MSDIVPGKMRCAKCNFQLTRQNLYMLSGTVGPGTNETEPCPNGCGPLWPMTWQQEAHELGERLEQMFNQGRDDTERSDATIAALRAELERKDAALCAIEKASACPWSCLVARAALAEKEPT